VILGFKGLTYQVRAQVGLRVSVPALLGRIDHDMQAGEEFCCTCSYLTKVWHCPTVTGLVSADTHRQVKLGGRPHTAMLCTQVSVESTSSLVV